jgi:hypothetical protein
MNSFNIRNLIRQVITEAKEAKKEEKTPKSSGKLVDLKKELTALKAMKEELKAAKFAEKSAETEVEFANLVKFAKELDKLKAGGIALESNIDAKIAEIKAKIESETHKIKEMIGLVSAPTIVGEAKPSSGMTKKEKSSVAKKAQAGKDIGKKGKGFEKVAKAAEKQYGSKEAGQKVAGA